MKKKTTKVNQPILRVVHRGYEICERARNPYGLGPIYDVFKNGVGELHYFNSISGAKIAIGHLIKRESKPPKTPKDKEIIIRHICFKLENNIFPKIRLNRMTDTITFGTRVTGKACKRIEQIVVKAKKDDNWWEQLENGWTCAHCNWQLDLNALKAKYLIKKLDVK